MSRELRYTDRELLKGVLNEEDEIFIYLYKESYPSVRWFVLRNGGSEEDARDLFQEAIIILHAKLKEDGLILYCSVKTYLFSVSRHLWLKELARRKKLNLTEIGEEQYLILEENEGTELDQELMKFYYEQFSQLSKECKKILNLHFRNVPIPEITRKLGYPSDNYTMNRKYRCKQRLLKKILRHPYFKNHDGR
ncbi:MAG: sigma-70 family RNA polymerase sigma factor [Bacteroidales bacterium]|mgnify:FL=1|nr:sigma-70 family RNA polymerase sigma factor [Bacteroidales bacterium]